MTFSSSAKQPRVWVLAIASLLAGYAQAISIAAPWPGSLEGQPLWWLQILSLAALVMLLDRAASTKQAALLAWGFALAWLCGTVWWLFISMHVYGGLAAPLAVGAIVALCGFLALYYAAAGYFYKRFRQVAGIHPAWSTIVFAAAWMLAELARDSWFTGFPWGAGGYAHVDGPLLMIVDFVGVYGVCFVAALIAGLVASIDTKKPVPHIVLLTTFACCIFYFYRAPAEERMVFQDQPYRPSRWNGTIVLPTDPKPDRQPPKQHKPFILNPIAITLLQGNIPQGEKFDATTGVKSSLDWYQQQLSLNTSSLVITPETAIPLLPRQLPEGYWDAVQKRYATGEQAALIGIPLGDYEKGYTNSVIGLKPNQGPNPTQPYQYDKHHLVPFGEFIPPLFKWFTALMNIPLGDFNRGAVGQPSFEWAGQRWAPNICYEDLFGDELARRFVDEKTAPTVMVNVSNIGWFGNSIAIDQHLHISRMRAMELGRPMVRATNTGATVIINHRGEVTHSLPRHTRGVLIGTVEGRQGITPYVGWAGRFGLWPLWFAGIAILLIAFCAGSIRATGIKPIK